MRLSEADFEGSLGEAAPPAGLDEALQALWWERRGDWERAHAIVAEANEARAAWVHAFLHRLEGDEGNARYWYARAGRPPAREAVEDERTVILAELLGASG